MFKGTKVLGEGAEPYWVSSTHREYGCPRYSTSMRSTTEHLE